MNDDQQSNEQIFRDLVNSILGEPKVGMDPCFDASVVERYLEENSIEREHKLSDETVVKIGRKNIAERGLAHYISLNSEQQVKHYILWPSTSDNENSRNGLQYYDATNIEEANCTPATSDQLTDLIFQLSELVAEAKA